MYTRWVYVTCSKVYCHGIPMISSIRTICKHYEGPSHKALTTDDLQQVGYMLCLYTATPKMYIPHHRNRKYVRKLSKSKLTGPRCPIHGVFCNTPHVTLSDLCHSPGGLSPRKRWDFVQRCDEAFVGTNFVFFWQPCCALFKRWCT